MNRPLLITDCDEVLLHMITHFRAWLDEAREVDFEFGVHDWGEALRYRRDNSIVPRDEVWPMLNDFFATEMHRQTLVPHARDALVAIADVADIVVLTNLGDHCHAGRVEQLDRVGIRHRVICNQGGKGAAVARLLEEMSPSVTVFVDDLPVHHDSVAKHAPAVWRLHMVAEPEIAPKMPTASTAHARIDDWSEAKGWVLERLMARQPAATAEAASA